ncbi:caspase-8 [Microcaecilia unicolor]|uniref:Caspase-8 n=1 Tax=Microcaecilia unicolor TaxID=1415580 RepID=A0A6P7YL53_9AMPH|nr:caspase-8-like [Microcaecilia unicolor]
MANTEHCLLLDISNELGTDDICAMKFLCKDHLSLKDLEDIKCGTNLFQCLTQKELLNEDNLSFLKELLLIINRNDLLRNKLNTSKEEMERVVQNNSQISQYRKLLFSISEEMSQNDITNAIFLLKDIPASKRKNATMLDILSEMEKMTILHEGSYDRLKTNLKRIGRRDLVQKIVDYEESIKASTEQQSPLETSFQEMTFKEEYQPWQNNSSTEMASASQLGDRKKEEKEVGDVYRMIAEPRGYCVIINNEDFKGLGKRKGTQKDVDALKRVFEWLHFETREHHNLTAEQLRTTLKSYNDHEHKDCFVCCILSHGKKQTVCGTDGEEVTIKDLASSFTASECGSLAYKPKLFFIQACQGGQQHKGIYYKKDSSEEFETDASPLRFVPDEADFLFAMSTVEGYESYRSVTDGSIFIQNLCKNLKLLCPKNEDLLSILTRVNNEVPEEQKKQMPVNKSTLRKKVIFPVPLAEDRQPEEENV